MSKATSELKIELAQSQVASDVTIMNFTGELDSSSIGKLSGCFDQVLQEKRKFAIADMSGVTVISSAALGELMGGKKRLIETGGDLVFAGMTLEIRTKINLMGANKIFRFYNDQRAAINAYKWEFECRADTVEVKFPPHLKIVPSVRQLVSRIAKQKGYSNRDSFRIETIVDEVCNNAVEHGKKDSEDNIDLELNIDREKIEINVTNVSDPGKVEYLKSLLQHTGTKTAKPDDRRGRGLALIKMLANDMKIDFSGNGTCVRVTKVREE